MEKLSRVKKYAQLREELMNDAESQVTSSDLSEFAKRLNRIDSAQFDTIETNQQADHDPVHLRRETYFEDNQKNEKEDTLSMTFNNEYLDEYINEVKQYNKERGFLSSENTTSNILNGLRKKVDSKEIDSLSDLNLEPSFEETTEIPIFSQNNDATSISLEVKNLLNASKEIEEEDKPEQAMTYIEADDEITPIKQSVDFEEELRKEKELREKLMNETVMMRSQLDDYDKELNDVNDSVVHTNRILNVVLIILILAMLVISGVLIYWIMLDKGVI